MKKLFLIFMSVVLSLSLLLTSCDGGENKADSGSGDSSSTVTSQETPPTESSVECQSTSDESQTGEHIHDHGEWRTVSEPTCSKSGSRERVCSCGDRETEPLGTIPHKYVNNVCNMCGQKDPNVFVPDYAAGQANAVGADSGLSSYTIQADYIYFSDGNNIRKMKTDGTGLKTVHKVTAGYAMNINVAGDWIYFWCNGETVGKSYIAKVRTDGTGFEKIVSSVYVWEMLVAKDTVYYTVYPVNGEYKDFAKDVMPLYSVSVNGGTPKQIHDGGVSNIVADASYIYFIHDSENGQESIRRLKHGSTSSSLLLSNKYIFRLSLENSKLYFYVIDMYSEARTIASISINGGSYTEYGKMEGMSDTLYVIGNKAYFIGGEEHYEEIGLVEYDLSTKRGRVVKEDYEIYDFGTAGEILIFENYDYDAEKLVSLTVYYSKTNTFKEIKVS